MVSFNKNCGQKLLFISDISTQVEVYSSVNGVQTNPNLPKNQIHSPWTYSTLSPTREVVLCSWAKQGFCQDPDNIK